MSDAEESDDEDEESPAWEKFFPEDSPFPDEYKEMKKTMKSTRADAIISHGLNISRKLVMILSSLEFLAFMYLIRNIEKMLYYILLNIFLFSQ